DHVKLMFDLQILAFQADITRVVTFQLTREQSNRTYPEIGVPDPHHPTSHHGGDPEKIAKIAKINTYHVSLFSDFLQKLKGTSAVGGRRGTACWSRCPCTARKCDRRERPPSRRNHRAPLGLVSRQYGSRRWAAEGGRQCERSKPLRDIAAGAGLQEWQRWDGE